MAAAKRGQDGQVVFTADSDAIITKGLAALMVRVLGRLRRTLPRRNVLDEIGLHSHLDFEAMACIHGEADEALWLGVLQVLDCQQEALSWGA